MSLNSNEISGAVPEYDIAFLGHFSKDRIIISGSVQESSGGAVYFGAIAAARADARAAAVTRAAAADRPLLQPMADAGVDVYVIESSETTSIENRYLDASQERRECTALGFAGAFIVDALPDIRARVWHAAGLIRGETDLDLLRALAARAALSADAQGFVRTRRGGGLVYDDWAEKRGALPLITYFKCDAAEAEILTGLTDVREAARALAGMGAREIVLSHPGGLLILADGVFSNTPFTPREVRGRTGRGDTCMAAFLARRLTHDPHESGRFAAALCSIKMEAPGPFSGTIDDVLERMK